MGVIDTFKKQGGMRLLKQYWKGGALFTGIGEFLLLGKSNTALEILRLATTLKTKQKLEKKYRWKLDELGNTFEEKDITFDRKIWVCWMQGMDNAPEIVKLCYRSLKKNISAEKLVLITEENYRDYVSFPKNIQLKIDNGIIKGAHMSDLLRLELLDRYGGTWIDSTVFCSGTNIPDYMLNSDLFMFQCLKPGRDGQSAVVSNWFITAKPHHKFIYFTKEMLYEYWKDNDELVDYFIFHDFFQMIIDKYPDDWNRVVPFSSSTPHILLLRLFEEYNQEIWDAVVNMSPFHKLTYKFDQKETKKENTFYKRLWRYMNEP